MSGADAPPNPSSEHPTSSAHDSTHVNLRVTYLHAGNPRPPHELGRISTDTTIGALKSRLQNELLENPRPEEQRLIYQGRPLLQDAVTLREALRLDGPIGPLPYTIHIIIQPRQAASHFRPDPSANVPTSPGVSGGVSGPGSVPPNTQAEQQPGHDQHPHHEQALRMQAMAQAHLNMLQQQLQSLQQQQGQNAPQRFSATFQINGQQVQPMHIPPNAHAQPEATPGTNESTNHHSQQQPPHIGAAPQRPLPQGQPNPLLNGLLNPGQPGAHVPFQRPLSVPPPTRPDSMHLPLHLPPPPQLPPPLPGFGLPLPPMRARPHQPLSQPTEPMVWLASSRNGPEALLFAPGHGYFSSGSGSANSAGRSHLASQIGQHLQNQNATRAAIAPTPTNNDRATGRNDAQPAANAQQPPANLAAGPLALQQPLQPGQPLGAQPRPQALNDDFMGLVIQRGWLFLRLYMFMFILSEPGTWRRYLLLALALIVCLLPRQNPLNHLMGAARRHVDNLIGPPAPQRAPNAAAPAQAQPGQAANPPAAGGARPAAVRGAVNLTPEQAAARILSDRAAAERDQQQRQQREANPNVLRDAFYRVEQAVALFLASLIPGVGERHVAAREEQRRERLRAEMERANAEREAAEQERRRREEAEQASGPEGLVGGEQGKADEAVVAAADVPEASSSAAAVAAEAGSSTGVEPRAGAVGGSDEQVRQRAVGEHVG